MTPGSNVTLPAASVVVPTFRRPGPLRRCIEALAQLDYPRERLEVIIVDDGGQDLSAAALAVLAPDLLVRLVSQAENGGPAKARNLGANRASGDLLAFTDDDCRPRPSWLRDLACALHAEPSALVGGRVGNALDQNLFATASQDLVSYLYDYFPQARALLPFFTANNMACRREEFLRVGRFDETFRYSAAEDRDLSERWAGEIGPLRHVRNAVVDHYHELTFRRFVRQHHYYGRGGVHLTRRRRRRGHGPLRPEPLGFYTAMLAYPVRHRGWRRGSLIAALLALSQIAGLTGMLAEAIRPVALVSGPNQIS